MAERVWLEHPSRHQLDSVISDGPPPLATYAYDCPRSAHAKQRVDSSSGIHAPYRLAQPNRLCTSATHQRSAGVPPASGTITYDALHRRTTKTVGSTTTRYIYDGWNVIEEHTNGTLTKTHTWGTDLSGTLQGAGGVGGLLLTKTTTPATSAHFHYDGNGNVTQLTDSNGTTTATYRYDAFGNTLTATGPAAVENRYRFSTKPVDVEIAASPLHYYGYRYYIAPLGRWPSRDPIEEEGGVNLYEFVGNSGIASIDILGTSVVDCICSRAAAGMANNAIERAFINGNDDAGGGNAFRHCLAGCEVSRNCGKDGEKSWDDREDPNKAGGRQDLENNQNGYNAAKMQGSCWSNCMDMWMKKLLDCGGKPCPPPPRGRINEPEIPVPPLMN